MAGTLPFAGVSKLAMGYTNRCAVVGPLEWRCTEGIYAPGPDGGAPALVPERSVRAPPGAPLRALFFGNVVSSGWLASDATLLLREDGTLQSSGSRNFIGRETSLSPGDPHFGDVLLSNVTDIDVGDDVCVVANGDVYCWGTRETPIFPMLYPKDGLPRRIVFPEPVVHVSTVRPSADASGQSGPRRLCAVVASGRVSCVGPNESGQVGDGTRMVAHVPVLVEGLTERAVDVVATRTSTCALLESGTVYCWGAGVAGALGNGFAADALVPTLVRLP